MVGYSVIARLLSTDAPTRISVDVDLQGMNRAAFPYHAVDCHAVDCPVGDAPVANIFDSGDTLCR